MVDSLKKSTIEYELVGIDNTNSKFKSAAAALNFGGDIATGDMLVFLHQDIIFNSEKSLATLVENYKKLPSDSAILGIFGATRTGKKEILEGVFAVDTLDECLVILNRDTFEKHRFNENLCNGWHLYVVELCIRIRMLNGLVAVVEHDITHLSTGEVNESYMKTFKQLLNTYKSEKWICTTCKTLPTNMFVFYLYYILWKIKKTVIGNYPLMSKLRKVI